MKKELIIEGMSCGHCSSRVKNTLEGFDGVSNVHVDLSNKSATFEMVNEISDNEFKNVISDIGFEVIEVK